MRALLYHLHGVSIALAVLSCSSLRPGVPSQYHGHYERRLEVNSFKSCTGSERWWVKDQHELLLPSVTWPDGSVGGERYVEVIGIVSERGSHGQLGAYDREITIVELLRSEAPRKACPEEPLSSPRKSLSTAWMPW